jgi:two-component system sensor histidine kinase and response regulator WspE
MSGMSDDSPHLQSMLELFRQEVDNQVRALTAGLLTLERDPVDAAALDDCMRAAHSLKGAARILALDAGVAVAHVMEDCFVAAQQGRAVLHRRLIDRLLRGVDWMSRIAHTPEPELGKWSGSGPAELASELSALQQAIERGETEEADEADIAEAEQVAGTPAERAPVADAGTDRVLRVSAGNLNRLLGLAGESLVESRWLKPFSGSLLRLHRMQSESAKAVEALGPLLKADGKRDEWRDGAGRDARAQAALEEAQRLLAQCQSLLAERLVDLEAFSRRASDRSQRLYDEALASRMRPFADTVGAFPRMVRDLGRALGKQVRLQIDGQATRVDRDILEKLDAPLTHLLRNAVDHGIEFPQERLQSGKPAEATIRMEAQHRAGLLQITVSDDGRGIALERLRERIVERGLTNAQTAEQMSEPELLEFLFLPGFTLKDTVGEISGRGVGLDVVQHMVKQVRGGLRVHTDPGQGTRFQLQLPLTLSVVRALLVEVGGEPYAFPLSQVGRTLKLAPENIEQLEGREHFRLGGQQIGLTTAHRLLGAPAPQPAGELPVIVIGDAVHSYGLTVDRFLGERELVVQPLDARLGKVRDISAGALMEDGSPVLIVDVADMIRSVEKMATDGELGRARDATLAAVAKRRKRVLVVDDSLTVRELERKLLGGHGYEVEVAVDGMDGWNAVRTSGFDLVVTDVDMPRMDGIELVGLIKRDPQLKSLPILIVSYKDREEDRRRGLEAGADYYLSKGSFHDERLLVAVVDLIGEAQT